jgi:hypothetical protein
MEQFNFSLLEGKLHVDGFPDAVKVVKLHSKHARRLAHIGQHQYDLRFATECLDAIAQGPSEPSVQQDALWKSAIIYYAKCFGYSKARFQLDIGKTIGKDSAGILAHKYYLALRNKHFVHDENLYGQTLVGAAINGGGKLYKVEKILALNITAQTLLEANFSNLYGLVRAAKNWVDSEFDRLCDEIATELEALPLAQLLSREDIKYLVPGLEGLDQQKSFD